MRSPLVSVLQALTCALKKYSVPLKHVLVLELFVITEQFHIAFFLTKPKL